MVNESDKVDDTVDPASSEYDAETTWRRLALQFDGHRMQAMWHLKTLLHSPEEHRLKALAFVSAPPLSGEVILDSRIRQIVTEMAPAKLKAIISSAIQEVFAPQYKVGDCLVSTVVYNLCKQFDEGTLHATHIFRVIDVDVTDYTLMCFNNFSSQSVKRPHKDIDGYMTVIGNIK